MPAPVLAGAGCGLDPEFAGPHAVSRLEVAQARRTKPLYPVLLLTKPVKKKRAAKTQKNAVEQVTESKFLVVSNSDPETTYTVTFVDGEFYCECKDFMYRQRKCKHIKRIKKHYKSIVKEIVKKIKEEIVIGELPIRCPECGDGGCTKYGLGKRKYKNIQIYKCHNRKCGKKFCNPYDKGLKFGGDVAARAVKHYATGSRNVAASHLEDEGKKVTGKTIENWAKKFVSCLEPYLKSLIPQVFNKWRTDEKYAKICGEGMYIYCMEDDETRFILAYMMGESKAADDISPMFEAAAERAGKTPSVLISDDASNFKKSCNDVYRQDGTSKVMVHLSHAHIRGDKNNNKMERLNGTFEELFGRTRGLKKVDSTKIELGIIYYNFLRKHMGINNKTPAEAAGIKILGNNKLFTLVKNAFWFNKRRSWP